MRLPFTPPQFLSVFRDYNTAIWPAQFVLIALALTMIAVARYGTPAAARVVVPVGLATLWAWTGAVYHLEFFAEINPAARAFGFVFLAQSIAWLFWSRSASLDFSTPDAARRWVSGALLAYALVGYPLLNVALGHRYPFMPTFGTPCPTVIATFGLLTWASPPPRWWLWCVPIGWALVGASAAFTLGIREDVGLPLAAVAAIVVQVRSRRRHL